MYKIIGGDQREYGPVTGDQIRQWIAEGRASRETRVQPEGCSDWVTLSSLPEFAEALASHSFASLVPPAGKISGDSLDLVSFYAARGASLDIFACFKRSWSLLRRHLWLLLGSSALILVISVALEFVPVIGLIAGAILHFVLWGGLFWLFLKLIRREPARFRDVFAGFEINFLQLALAGVVSTALVLLGFVFCILPGIYLFVAWFGFVAPLIMDKLMDFWPAMELSRRVVTKNWWSIFSMFLISVALLVAGALALGVGLFAATPLVVGAIVYAYEDLFGGPSVGVSVS
jgi:hypothetical protein